MTRAPAVAATAFALAALIGSPALAQAPAGPPPGVTLPPGVKLPPPTPFDSLVSPEAGEGGAVTLRAYAPKAVEVKLEGEFQDFFAPPVAMTRGADGVWSVTLHPGPGTYRYDFLVDGAHVLDARNTATSRSQAQVRSLMHVPGLQWEDDQAVPHGAVAEVVYRSAVFPPPRRMHVYTPPGYGHDGRTYPVLYLLHGGGDSDESWSSVGRAGVILDNLIAAGKAVPMVVVMPAGHVPSADGSIASAGAGMTGDPATDPFTADLLQSIVPYVQANYRVAADRDHRAIAGLSMGGIQAANIGLTHAELFSQVLIFSSGWFPPMREQFEARYAAKLDADRSQLRLLWVGYGKTDIARDNALAMLKVFDRHGLHYATEETEGGHTWTNWRRYLTDTAPLLFR